MPATTGWVLELWPSTKVARRERLPRFSGGQCLIRADVPFDEPLRLQSVSGDSARVSLNRLTIGRLQRRLTISMRSVQLPAAKPVALDLHKLETGIVRGIVHGVGLARRERLIVAMEGQRRGQSLVAADGTFVIELPIGRHGLQVRDLLSGYDLGRSEPVVVEAGAQASCEIEIIEISAGAVDVEIGLPDGCERTAMGYLVARARGVEGGRPQCQIPITNLRGRIRLLLPAGTHEFGFQRARGALSGGGGTRMVSLGWQPVEVRSGEVTMLTLQEPARLTTKELADERHQ